MNDLPERSTPSFTSEQLVLCSGPLPPDAITGLQLFNEGHYYEAHEALETAWRAEPTPIRELYRGILQVGAGYYKIQRGSYNGALKFFLSCRKWLDLYPDICRGVNVRKLCQDFQQIEAELIRLGPEQVSLFNQDLFQPVEYSIE
jgi:predicted metal-dependent hydrolase